MSLKSQNLLYITSLNFYTLCVNNTSSTCLPCRVTHGNTKATVFRGEWLCNIFQIRLGFLKLKNSVTNLEKKLLLY